MLVQLLLTLFACLAHQKCQSAAHNIPLSNTQQLAAHAAIMALRQAPQPQQLLLPLNTTPAAAALMASADAKALLIAQLLRSDLSLQSLAASQTLPPQSSIFTSISISAAQLNGIYTSTYADLSLQEQLKKRDELLKKFASDTATIGLQPVSQLVETLINSQFSGVTALLQQTKIILQLLEQIRQLQQQIEKYHAEQQLATIPPKTKEDKKFAADLAGLVQASNHDPFSDNDTTSTRPASSPPADLLPSSAEALPEIPETQPARESASHKRPRVSTDSSSSSSSHTITNDDQPGDDNNSVEESTPKNPNGRNGRKRKLRTNSSSSSTQT